MKFLFKSLYIRMRKKELERAIKKFKKLKIGSVLNCITRNCWKNNIYYEVLYKAEDILSIKLKGKNESAIVWFHHTKIVKLEDYKRFIVEIYKNKVTKGTYITSGVFEEEIYNLGYKRNKRIVLEDCMSFVSKQLGLYGNTNDVFKKKRLNFFSYLPI